MFNKFKFLLSTMVLMATVVFGGELVDPRDGQKYKTVQIGDQIWMAENLKYKKVAVATNKQGDAFYSWERALSVCPDGWKLPDAEDFFYLISEAIKACATCGDEESLTEKDFIEVSKILRSRGGWIAADKGLNKLNFNVTPAGAAIIEEEGVFQNVGFAAGLWSSSTQESDAALLLVMPKKVQVNLFGTSEVAFPVRCIKENQEIMTDSRDGQTYKTVKIGDQIWMAENLNYKTLSSVCFENDDENCERFGRKYNKSEAEKACPDGWRLPSITEYRIAARSFGGKPDVDVENNWFGSGDFINAMLGEIKMPQNFCNIGSYNPTVSYSDACFWAFPDADSDEGYDMFFGRVSMVVIFSDHYKNNEFSVRCVRK